MRYVDSEGYNITYTSGREIADDVNQHFHVRELFRYNGPDLVLYQKAYGGSNNEHWKVLQYDTIIYDNHKVIKYFSKLAGGTRNLKKLYWSYNENGLPVRFSRTTGDPGNYELYPLPNGMVYLPKNMKPRKVRHERFYYYRQCKS